MQKSRKRRYITVFILLGIGTLLFFILNICIGSVSIALPDAVKVFAGQGSSETITRILWDIRLPRAVSVLILGEIGRAHV